LEGSLDRRVPVLVEMLQERVLAVLEPWEVQR
jgi:hypothetical protein